MSRRTDLSNQHLASWFYWWYKEYRRELFPDSFTASTGQLTEAEENQIWERVAFRAADRFPGEDETRLAAVLDRARQTINNLWSPFSVSSGRKFDEIRNASTRNTRIGFRRRRG